LSLLDSPFHVVSSSWQTVEIKLRQTRSRAADLVKALHVMTVPTTVLVDARGKIAAMNPGLTPWRTIVDQCQAIV